MKKLLYTIITVLGIFGTTGCSDMLESDSSRQLFDPALDQKTDSVFYAYGIMQAMQQLADQYYLQNEMRGDLVTPTSKASTHLRQLASFDAGTDNKYDSVYLYYKVINNCNYYLAHRDTTLMTGKKKVAINEYAAVASFRAWTYLQLIRQYGRVPYVTEPVTTIEQINTNTTRDDYTKILLGEAQVLEDLKARYPEEDLSVPTFGHTSQRSIGYLNWGNREKFIYASKCFIPLNIVLGDIYLELGEGYYEKAARCYFEYLRYTGYSSGKMAISVNDIAQLNTRYSFYSPIFKDFTLWPDDFNESMTHPSRDNTWGYAFSLASAPGDVISYIPMAVNYREGKTTDIPAIFGYNYYGSENKNTVSVSGNYEFELDFVCPKTDEIQVVPSQAYCDSARKAQYYYVAGETQLTSPEQHWNVKNGPFGDARAYIIGQGMDANASSVYTQKPSTGNIILYRNTTVWLHLAEALNRMGYPDAAFAVLKNGIHTGLANSSLYLEVYLQDEDGNDLLDENGDRILDTKNSHTDDRYYLTPESYYLLSTTLPFLSQENAEIFSNGVQTPFIGIHAHGAGKVALDVDYSPYRYGTVLEAKIADISEKFNLNLQRGADGKYDKMDYINAMEDLLCDEYAMEFAFEGTRFSDLRRLAIHKNQAGTYGSNFGDEWLSRKLENNKSGITVTSENCYLPYK